MIHTGHSFHTSNINLVFDCLQFLNGHCISRERFHSLVVIDLYNKPCFVPDGLVAKKIKSVLEDKPLLASIQRCRMEDTGDLESYHSMLNKNCPKMYCFSHQGMTSRLVPDLVPVIGIWNFF